MSFRNRCQLAGAEGLIQLSIPLGQGRDQKTIMKDVRIADKGDWQTQHWKTIVSCYSRSPWFEFYRDELGLLYQRKHEFLSDWNLACFGWAIRTLGLSLEISLTETWRKDYDPATWIDLRGALRPSTIAQLQPSGPSGNLPASQDLSGAIPGLSLTAPQYRQVFQERTGFLPGLSILDLLFCEGPNARRLLLDEYPL